MALAEAKVVAATCVHSNFSSSGSGRATLAPSGRGTGQAVTDESTLAETGGPKVEKALGS